MVGKPKGFKRKPAVYDKNNFVARYGGGTAFNSQSIGPGGRTRMTAKQNARIMKGALAADQKERQQNNAASRRYDQLVAGGIIRPRTELERLKRKAEGHPDNPAVQAARRVLAKKEARIAKGVQPPKPQAKPAQQIAAAPKPAMPMPKRAKATTTAKPRAKAGKGKSRVSYGNIYAQFGL